MSLENENRSSPKINPFLPFIFGLLLAIGVAIGYFISNRVKNNVFSNYTLLNTGNKMNSIVDYILQNYVDTINKKDLEDEAITSMLHSLDPHSDYIPASEFQQINEPLQGNFEGIGVEFNIFNDTITVVTPISGGPSEKAGILAGDKIIYVEKEKVSGVKITNKLVFSKLRGKKGTKVKISVLRNGNKKLYDFTITRGEIPLYSVDVSYMIRPNIGYIKVSRFAKTTYEEFIQACKTLQRKGMKKMILDLRGNPGGILPAAVNICDEFLSKGYTIVYTEGKASPKNIHKSTSTGGFENGEIVVLIDEGSASASEIIAGALQDNDRATIIGRRSFGKGLVQEQMDLEDGSAIRLTVARYYTPTGRCIQKPYSENKEEYYEEEYKRLENGELFSADSIKFADSLKFTTPGGKTVYGGGGIMPDVFIPIDTTERSSYLSKIVNSGLLSSFAFMYADKNRANLLKYGSPEQFVKNFSLNETVFNEFLSFLETKGVQKEANGIRKSGNLLKNQLAALIGRAIYNNEAFYPVINGRDKAIMRAVETLSKQKK